MFKRNKKRGGSSQSGQATVEYLLLLVVIIFLGRLILTPLGEGLRDFSGKLIGPEGYYSCLMENGLLPVFDNISNGSNSLDCGARKQESQAAFNTKINSMSSTANNLSGSNGSNSSNGSKDSKGKQASSDDQDSQNGADKNSGRRGRKKRGARSNYSAGQDTRGGQASSNLSKIESQTNKGKTSKNKSKGLSLDDGDFESEFNSPKKRNRRTKNKFKFKQNSGFLGVIYIEDEEEEKRAPLFRSKTSVTKRQEASVNKQKNLVKNDSTSSNGKLKETNVSFQLGNFLKYFLIVGMIVAILLIIFSQAMEFQSRD